MNDYVVEIILLNGARWRFNKIVPISSFIVGLENREFITYFEDGILVFQESK